MGTLLAGRPLQTPTTPTLNAPTVVSGTEIDLTWVNGSNTNSAQVFRSLNGLTFTPLSPALGNVSAYNDTTTIPLTPYYYEVVDTSIDNLTATSNIQATTSGGNNAPTNLVATEVDPTEIDLTWSAPSPAPDSYVVQRSLDGTTWADVVGVVPTSYNNTGLTTATLYYYRIFAVTNSVRSNPSNIVSVSLKFTDNFDDDTAGSLPSDWSQWGSSGAMTATVVASTALDSTGTNALSKGSALIQQIWPNAVTFPNDVAVSCLILPSVPAGCGIIFRCTNPNGSTPTFYYLECGRNGGCYTGANVAGTYGPILQSCTAPFTATGSLFKITAHIQGNTIKCSQQCVFDAASPGFGRTGQWLQNNGAGAGTWITSQNEVFCLIVNDSTIASGGVCGVFSGGNDSSACLWDDFQVTTSAIDTVPPVITLTSPADGSTQPGSILLQATATDNIAMLKVDWYADGSLGTPIATQLAPGIGNNVYAQTLPQGNLVNGTHTIQAKATDLTGNATTTPAVSITVTGSNTPVRPTITPARSWINRYQTAYSGFVLDAGGQAILPFIDIADLGTQATETALRSGRANVVPLAYITESAISELVLMSWLNYADANSLDREEAFFHAGTVCTQNIAVPGAQTHPVMDFWQLFNTGGSSQASGAYADNAFTWTPTSGNSSYIGFPDRFRSITTVGQVPAGPGYNYVIEYCTAIDGSGNATGWNPLTIFTDGTSLLTASGTIDFDPPADWVPCIASGQPASFSGTASSRFFYVRFRCTHVANSGATSPTATGIRSADYLSAGFTANMTVPVFDTASDGGSKGWLTAAEYSGRAAGKDAHFKYQSRLASSYGPMRLATNPGNADFVNYVVISAQSYFVSGQLPDFEGLDFDNSSGSLTGNCPFSSGSILEAPTSNSFLTAYAAMLQNVWNNIGTHANGSKRFVLPNVSNFTTNAITIVKHCPAALLEFLFHLFGDRWSDFETKTANLAAIQTATPPTPPITVPDISFNGAPYGSQLLSFEDPKNGYNALCLYYQYKDSQTFFTIASGDDPKGIWPNHYSLAEAVNVGTPSGAFVGSAAAADPNDATLTYKVYKRSFANGLVLFRPLSYKSGGAGVWYAPGSSAPVSLGASYYQVVTPCVILGTSSGTGGAIRIQYDGINSGLLTEGQQVRVAFVFGTTEANGVFPIHIVDSTHVELSGTTFANAFTTSPNAQMFWIAQTPVITVNLVNGQGMILVNSPSLAI